MNAFTSRRNILRNLNSSNSIADLSIALCRVCADDRATCQAPSKDRT